MESVGVGREGRITAGADGMLCVDINEDIGLEHSRDNTGMLTVRVVALPSGPVRQPA